MWKVMIADDEAYMLEAMEKLSGTVNDTNLQDCFSSNDILEKLQKYIESHYTERLQFPGYTGNL